MARIASPTNRIMLQRPRWPPKQGSSD
jgi:hypothetical protein